MKTILKGLLLILLNVSTILAVTWDDCIEKYTKAKNFSENTQLAYVYLKSTKRCLTNFKKSLEHQPNPEFTIEAMSENIVMLEKYIDNLVPSYNFSNNILRHVPTYTMESFSLLQRNEVYDHFIKFKKCNGVHAGDKIYTAKHCKIKDSHNVHFDLSTLPSDTTSELEVAKLDLEKEGSFKYYSMSKIGMFFGVLLEENNCTFHKAKNIPTGINTTLDLSDLEKEYEIRSSCLAIPSNSGGGVFQDGKLVAIISKTVFNKEQFLYSIVEPIIPVE